MPPPDDAPTDNPDDARDRRRHEFLTPLTVIRGRAELLGRAVRRSPTLGDGERERMLAGLAAIDAAVGAVIAAVDEAGNDDARDGSAAVSPPRRPAGASCGVAK